MNKTILQSALFSLILLSGFNTLSAQVIDFGNVTPDQSTGHIGPITATGADGVEVTVEFINIETSDVVNSGLYSARDCTGTNFEGATFSGPATAGCATSNFDDNKHAVRLTFDEPVDISRIDLAKFSDFTGDGSDWDKEVRFFEGTPTTTFPATSGNPGPTNFDFSGLMNMSANQAITDFSVGFTDVTQIWFYAAFVNIPDHPDFDGVAVEMNWVVDQIHYGAASADPPTVTTTSPTSINTTSATLGGNVTNDGGAPVSVRGIVYSTSPDPDLDDEVEQIGSGTGSFQRNITGLSPGTTYYVRAYATNSEDTAFGSQQQFTTQVNVASINRQSPSEQLTNNSSVVYEVNLTGPVSGLGTSNFSVTQSGASVSSVSGSGSTYQVEVNTGSGDGTLRLDLANTTGVSPSITSLPYTAGQSYTIDNTPPVIENISRNDPPTSDPISDNEVIYTVAFSEQVENIATSDFQIPTQTGFATGTIASVSATSGTSVDVTVDNISGDGILPLNLTGSANITDQAGNEILIQGPTGTREDYTIDNTPPTITISSSESSPTNADPIPVEIDFSESVTGFGEGDITVSGGTTSNFSGSGENYTVDIIPAGDGTITVDVNAGVAQDVAGNDNTAATQFSIDYDISEPGVSIATTEGDPTNADDFEVTFTFTNPVFNFEQSDIQVTNAQLSNFTGTNGDTEYTATVAPDGDGLVTIDVPQGSAQDAAGNDNEPSETFEITSDRTAPTIASIQRSSGLSDPTNESPFNVVITFSEEIADFDETELSVTNGSATGFTSADNIEFTVTIEPDPVTTSSIMLDIGVPAGVFTDLAGNTNVADFENFTIEFGDTRPTAVLTSTEQNFTNAASFEVTLNVTEIFGEPVTSITAADFTITRANITNIDDTSNPEFVLTIEPLEEGEISIQLNENVLTDVAGNQNEASNEFTILYDVSPPQVAITSAESDPTNSDNFEVTFTFTKPVDNFTQGDISVTNAQLSNFTGTDGDTEYTVTVAPDGDGLVTIDVPQASAQDNANNDNDASDTFEITSNRTDPTIVSMARSAGLNDPTNESEFDLVITFNEEIADFDETELSVTNGSATGFTSADNIEFTVTIEPDPVTTSSIMLDIGVPAGVFTDLAGNANDADTENFTIEFGDTRPTALLTSTEQNPTNADDFEVTQIITEIFGEPVSGITAADFTITRAQITNIDDTGNPEFVLTIEPQEEGEVSIQLNENVLTDVAGNQNEASNEFTILYDVSPPQVAITSAESDPTNSDNFEVTFTFTKPVDNFTQGDISVTNAQLSNFTGTDGDTEYTVTVAPDGDGLVTIDVPQASAQDNANNDNDASDTFEIISDRTPPSVVSIDAESGISNPTNEPEFDIIITFSEEVSSFGEADVEIVNAIETGSSTSDNISYRVSIEADPVTDSSNTITVLIPEGIVSDAAGNLNEAADEPFAIEFGDTRPLAVITGPESENVTESPIVLTVSITEIFGEEISGFDVDNLLTENVASITITEDNNPEFVLEVEPQENGEVTVQLAEGAIHDAAGNSNVESNLFSISFDTSPPQVVLISPDDEAIEIPVQPEFSWEEAERAVTYDLQVSSSSSFSSSDIVKNITGISGTDYQAGNELSFNSTNYWRVRGNNSGVRGDWSEPRSFVTVPAPPAKVVLTGPETDGENIALQPELNWEKADRAEHYQLQVSTGNGFDKPFINETELSGTDFRFASELDRDQTYRWRVRGVNRVGATGEWSDAWTFTTIPEPPAVAELISPIDSIGSVPLKPEFKWEEAERAVSYNLQLAENPEFSEIILSEEEIQFAGFSAEIDLEQYAAYYWRVQGVNGGGTGDWSEAGMFITLAEAPALVFPAEDSENISIAPQLTWSSVYDETSFEVRLDTDPLMENPGAVLSAGEPFVVVDGLSGGTTHYWQVRLADKNTTSPWSEPGSFITRRGPDNEETVSIIVDFPQGDESDIFVENYKLIGIPGSGQTFVDEVFTAPYEESWQAFADNGASENFLVEYDQSTNRFAFGAGAAYWMFSREAVQAEKTVSQSVDETDSFGIQLHKGWNIITNPYTEPADWQEVLEFNNIEADLFGYHRLFSPSQWLEPMKGYYFFNNPSWGLEKLDIPFGSIKNRRPESQNKKKETETPPAITLSAEFQHSNLDKTINTDVAFIIAENDTGQYNAPHPSLTHTNFGAVIDHDDPESLYRTLYRKGVPYDPDGTSYNLTVKAPLSTETVWTATITGLSPEAQLLMVNPVTKGAYMIGDGQAQEISVTEPEITWQVYIGDEMALMEIRNSHLSDVVVLKDNYPNPFSSATNISYALPEETDVRLDVFDVLGRRVDILVDERKPKGWHTVTFENPGLASGVYFYRLLAGDEILTEKMMLVK